MTVKDDDKMPIGHNSSLLQRFHEAWDRLEGIGATLGEDGGEGGGESRVIGHYVLLEGGGLPRSPSAPRALLGASARSSAKPSHNTCGLPQPTRFVL